MRTIPLHGKKAAGRVALVDDGDYDLVMPYTWRVYERQRSARYPAAGPYAVTSVVRDGKNCTLQMHVLIMGRKFIDHINHDGLDNQRSNLRPATRSQNNWNARPQAQPRTSPYKGVFLLKESGLWRASIRQYDRMRRLGDFVSELEAAYAYDAAARELFGEFACPNFADTPTQAMRSQWEAERRARRIAVDADARARATAAVVDWWARREPRIGTCVVCGKEYAYRSARESIYCSNACSLRALRRRRAKERQAEREQAGILV